MPADLPRPQIVQPWWFGERACKATGFYLRGLPPLVLPAETMCGALVAHVVTETADYQPMGSNMGLLPPLERPVRDKRLRYQQLAERAVAALRDCLAAAGEPAAE